MAAMMAALAAGAADNATAPPLLVGTGKDKVHLLVAITADRGLAGAFNTNVGRAARNLARRLMSEGKTVKIITVGRKGRDYLRREMASNIVGDISFASKKRIEFADVQAIGMQAVEMLGRDEFDVATVVYNRFVSVITQSPAELQIIPPLVTETGPAEQTTAQAIYEFEPDEETILAKLLPKNLAIQLYRAQLESSAGEQGARMTAMDNATRNAGEAINKLTLNYNRTRQANITRELIEIISGAEAL
jgi:F-type H+-transporting ATPase subunit gamma